MSPEDKALLEKTFKLAQENALLLERMDRRNKWSLIWGFLKLVIIVVPLVFALGYFEPYFSKIGDGYRNVQDLVGHIDLPF